MVLVDGACREALEHGQAVLEHEHRSQSDWMVSISCETMRKVLPRRRKSPIGTALFAETFVADDSTSSTMRISGQLPSPRRRRAARTCRGVVPDRQVDEAFELREGHDGVEPPHDVATAQAEDRAVEEHVLPAAEVRVNPAPSSSRELMRPRVSTAPSLG